jgi:N-acetylglucosaminyl-diphospho-decaprenol L-rhamnosyltransferase
VPGADASTGEAADPDQPPIPEIAVVVVNYDSGDHLRSCIAALEDALGGMEAELLVVDNTSTDGSLDGVEELDPRVRVIRNQENLGYGRACNQGFSAATAPFVCLLNPDIIPDPECLQKMAVALAAHPDVGILGPRLRNPDGSVYPSARIVPTPAVALGHAALGMFLPNNRFSRVYKLMDVPGVAEMEVEWVSGAAMLVRREAFQVVGGFDEDFFMYVEDLDLCVRLGELGWKALYYPQVEMTHHVAGSSRRTPYSMIRHHHQSLLRYAAKRLNGPARLLLPLVGAGVLVRMCLAWADYFIRRVTGVGYRHH